MLYHQSYSTTRKFIQALLIIFIVLTPIPFLGTTIIDPFKETVFGGTYSYFNRPINQYLFLINNSFCLIMFIFSLLGANSFNYSNFTKLNNILSKALSPLFIIKSMLKKRAMGTVIMLILISLLFFSTTFNITELGYVSALIADNAETPIADFDSQFNSRNEIADYDNSVWFSMISMTTIGYGDMAVGTSLSRVFMVILAIASAVFFPLFIVAVEDMLEMGYQENMSFQIISQTNAKDEMRENASVLIQRNFRRYRIATTLAKSKAKRIYLKSKASYS